MNQLGLEMSEEESKQMSEGTPEPAPAPATPEPVAQEPTPAPVAPPPQPEKMVPLAALIEERERIKEYKRQMKAVEDLRLQVEAMRQQQQPPQPPQHQIPPFEEDPLTHMKERLKQVDAVEQTQRMMMQQQVQHNQLNQIRQVIDHTESTFRKEHPDYDMAINHLTNFRRQELAELGVTNPVQVNQILAQNALGLWQQATVSGKNPPEVAYALAQKYGYKPAQVAVPEAQVQQAQQQVQTQQDKDLQTIAAGQQAAAKTLSGAGKTTNDTEISIQAMLDASPEDFDKMWKEKFKNAK